MKDWKTDSELTIGALAERTGCSVPTIRYYEDIGLIPPAKRRPSGHRFYQAAAEKLLTFVLPTLVGFHLKRGPRKPDVLLHEGCRTLKGDHRGMSLFDKKNPRLSFKWYCIPANARIPPGIAITRDSDDFESDDPIHYTAAPKDDMPLSLFLQHLKELAVDVKPA